MTRTTELGTAPVHKLLWKYALPAIIAMTATSLYNIVDSIYIGHGCGALALGALTVAKPFMDICAAFGSLVGVGASSLLAIYLGEKDYDRANRVLGNVIVMNIILSWRERGHLIIRARVHGDHPLRKHPHAYLFRSECHVAFGGSSPFLHGGNDCGGDGEYHP